MKKNIILAIFSLSLISYKGIAQDFLNLDFEYGVYKAQPRKWAIEGEGEMYDARLDSTTAKSGNKSLYITLKNGEVYTFLSLPGKLIAGKSIQIEGYIKFKNADSLVSMLAFRDPIGGKPNVSQPIKGINNEWTFISHTASFPDNYSSDRLLIALIGSGTGSFWFDNVKIKINGQEYGNGAPDFREPTNTEIMDLNKMAAPIKSLASDADLTDLVPLNKIIGNSNIVALGENSHGSSTIYKLKLRMVKYMVEKQGFSIFALESPIIEADRINEYVLNGTGTLNDVIKYLAYPSWQTEEMIDIIQWIKSYNQTTKKKVEFKGFDMQNGMSAFEAVEDFAKVNDTALLVNLAELKKWYDDATNGKQQWNQVYQKSETIYQYLLSKNNSAYAGVEVQSLARIKHYMNIFVQSLSSQYKSEKTRSRDEYMAQNINWLVKNYEGRKIILSGDNTHVTKASGKMGSFLSDWYGEKYIVFGFTYNNGSYSAYGPEKYYEVHPSYVGTYEYFFSKSKFKNFLLDIRTINDIPILNTTAGFRSIGSRPQETTQFTEINLKKHFDVIVYIENSIHTTPLTK
ncbi:erythromycin esterase family protein [Runella sp.]|uniref:erythromycin esterase family protein n=1 Tax=Runella sp. TaxID=1960881 RepID=UPI003D0B4AFE